jgi:hypothetical protein
MDWLERIRCPVGVAMFVPTEKDGLPVRVRMRVQTMDSLEKIGLPVRVRVPLQATVIALKMMDVLVWEALTEPTEKERMCAETMDSLEKSGLPVRPHATMISLQMMEVPVAATMRPIDEWGIPMRPRLQTMASLAGHDFPLWAE